MNISEKLLSTIVKQVVSQLQNTQGEFQKQVDPSGIIGIKSSTVELEPFEGRDDVLLKDVTTLSESPHIGCGIMELKDGASFEWTLTYDEYDVIQEGCLEIEIDGRIISGEIGDIIYIPKGSHIHFRTPNHAKYTYVVYPADWQ